MVICIDSGIDASIRCWFELERKDFAYLFVFCTSSVTEQKRNFVNVWWSCGHSVQLRSLETQKLQKIAKEGGREEAESKIKSK